jgi:hypothetical protein
VKNQDNRKHDIFDSSDYLQLEGELEERTEMV